MPVKTLRYSLYRHKYAFWSLWITVIALYACSPIESIQIAETGDAIITNMPSLTVLPINSSPVNVDASSTPAHSEPTAKVVDTPTIVPSPTEDTRLTAYYWRDWPIVPELSVNAKEILLRAKQDSNININSLSKVGDCQMTSDTFLGGYVREQYPIPSGLKNTVTWFSESMMRDSVTSYGGLGVNSVLNPMFAYAAGYKECDPKESPLACELRNAHPVVIVIGLGTNWKPYAEISFEKYLREVVDQVLDAGALPILSTKADNVELDWKLNLAIAQIAYDYDLPLVNVWRSVQDLPNRGLLPSPKEVYLTPDGWMRRNHAWLNTLQQVYMVLNEE